MRTRGTIMPQPKIQYSGIKEKINQLDQLGQAIKKTKNIDSASVSMEKFSALKGAIKEQIKHILNGKPKPKEKVGSACNAYLEHVERIEHTYANDIRDLKEKIKLKQKKDTAAVQIVHTLSDLNKVVVAYEQAGLIDKEKLYSAFAQLKRLFKSQLGFLDDKTNYNQQLSLLNYRLEERARVLAHEEFLIKKKIAEVAKHKETLVNAMSINEQIMTIAPPKVQNAVLKLLAGKSQLELELLLLNDASQNPALSNQVTNQMSSVAEHDGVMRVELAAVSNLSKVDQQKLVLALMSGDMEVAASIINLSQSTQMVLVAQLVNQLAVNSDLPHSDVLGIQQFISGLVTNMIRVEQGEVTHLSVVVEVDNTVRGIHIDLQGLVVDPVNMAMAINLELLKMGASIQSTQMVVAFTSPQQVGALLALEGRRAGGSALNPSDFVAVTQNALNNPSSSNALTLVHQSIVKGTILAGVSIGQRDTSRVQVTSVAEVLRALAIIQLTTKDVLNPTEQKKMGIDRIILGGNDKASVGLLVQGIISEGTSSLFLLTDEHKKLKPLVINLSTIDVIENNTLLTPIHFHLNEKSPVKKNPVIYNVSSVDSACGDSHSHGDELISADYFSNKLPLIDKKLVANFEKALGQLIQLHDALRRNYGEQSDVVKQSNRLTNHLINALVVYKTDHNSDRFYDSCNDEVRFAKTVYNTHRGTFIGQCFGAVYEALNNLFERLFHKKDYTQRVGFFNNSTTMTHSAGVLYQFHQDIQKAFFEASLTSVYNDDFGVQQTSHPLH